ncbi:MAG: exo-alpha-sialidase [Pirellulales bacterium]|nr:exo-alpha-sialidase [Pirellulales bacterium]
MRINCIPSCTCVVLAAVLGWSTHLLADPAFEQTDLFVSGQGGYHTYRIPTMAVLPNGNIVAIAEGRKTSDSDAGDIDLVIRRSTDGGRTWSPIQLLYEEGGNDPITIGNPTPIVDQTNGYLHLLFARNNERLFITSSTDNGVTFSTPTELTNVAQNFNYDWTRLGGGPTAGIQMTSGRLVAPIWLNKTIGVPDTYRTGALISNDHGQTWQAGSVLSVDATLKGTNESAIVQKADGSLLVTMRTNAGTPARAASTSADGGLTWTAATQDASINPQMTTIKTSMVRYSLAGDNDVNRLLYSGPGGTDRSRMNVWLSLDEAQTWSVQREINTGPAAYSELAVTADKTILLAYEMGQSNWTERIALARFNLDWILQAPSIKPIVNGDFEDTYGWDAVGTTACPAGWTANDNRQNAAAMLSGTFAIGGQGHSAFMPAFPTDDESQRREIRQATNSNGLGTQWRLSLDFASEDPGNGDARSLSMGISHGNGQITLRVVDADNDGRGGIQYYNGSWQTIAELQNTVLLGNDVTATPLVHHLTVIGHYDGDTPTYDIILADPEGNVTRATGLTGWLNAAPAIGAIPSEINFNTFLSTGDYLVDNVVLLGRDVWLPGDATGDGTVDDEDANILASHWLQKYGVTWEQGDFNNDGRVDDLDASIMAAHWQENQSGHETALPEPGGTALIFTALPLLAWRFTGKHAGLRPFLCRLVQRNQFQESTRFSGKGLFSSRRRAIQTLKTYLFQR